MKLETMEVDDFTFTTTAYVLTQKIYALISLGVWVMGKLIRDTRLKKDMVVLLSNGEGKKKIEK